jgi:hypothetical protein
MVMGCKGRSCPPPGVGAARRAAAQVGVATVIFSLTTRDDPADAMVTP